MSSIRIVLKRVSEYEWQLYSPNGYTIGPRYRGDKYKALEWAKAFVSTWNNWTVELYKGEPDEKTDRFS